MPHCMKFDIIIQISTRNSTGLLRRKGIAVIMVSGTFTNSFRDNSSNIIIVNTNRYQQITVYKTVDHTYYIETEIKCLQYHRRYFQIE